MDLTKKLQFKNIRFCKVLMILYLCPFVRSNDLYKFLECLVPFGCLFDLVQWHCFWCGVRSNKVNIMHGWLFISMRYFWTRVSRQEVRWVVLTFCVNCREVWRQRFHFLMHVDLALLTQLAYNLCRVWSVHPTSKCVAFQLPTHMQELSFQSGSIVAQQR